MTHDLPETDVVAPRSPEARRLVWLLGGRLTLTSLLLGGTLLFTVSPETGYGSFTPQVLLVLVTATYLSSILVAIWLARAPRIATIVGAQIVWDLLLTSGLVYLSRGASSVFSFLYGTVVLAGALTMGPRAAQATAAVALLLYTSLSISLANGWIPHPPDQDATNYLISTSDLGLSLLINIVGLIVLTGLSVSLAARLRQTGGALARAARSVVALTQRNDDIVRSIASGLLTTDLAGQVQMVNPAGAAMFHASPDAVQGRPLSDLIPAAAKADSPTLRAEGTGVRLDGGTFPVGFTASPLRSADGQVTGSLIAFQDLTEITDLRRAAARAERLAALGRLAASLAHEIRNPLSSISGSVEMVRDASSLGDEDRRLLGIVASEVERLDGLVTTMLQVGQPSEPRVVSTDLNALAAEVVEVAQQGLAARAQVAIAFDPAGEPRLAKCDPDQMRQVLWNLLKNAVQASKSGDTVRVEVGSDTDPDGQPRPWFTVSDSGDGIPREEQDRLFDAFYSKRPHGVGLGLALVSQIIERHRGSVSVDSEPGEGATFRVDLPASGAPAAPKAPPGPS